MKNYTTDAMLTISVQNMDLQTFYKIRGIINRMALDYHFNYETEFLHIHKSNNDDTTLDNEHTCQITS